MQRSIRLAVFLVLAATSAPVLADTGSDSSADRDDRVTTDASPADADDAAGGGSREAAPMAAGDDGAATQQQWSQDEFVRMIWAPNP